MTLVVSGTSHELRRDQALRVSTVRPDRSKARQPSISSRLLITWRISASPTWLGNQRRRQASPTLSA